MLKTTNLCHSAIGPTERSFLANIEDVVDSALVTEITKVNHQNSTLIVMIVYKIVRNSCKCVLTI